MIDETRDQKTDNASTSAGARITISEKDFVLQYRPLKNHLRADAEFDGYMFDDHGLELEFIRRQVSRTVWSLVEDLEGGAVFISGFHADHSMGHFVSRKPVPGGAEIEVDIHRDENMT